MTAAGGTAALTTVATGAAAALAAALAAATLAAVTTMDILALWGIDVSGRLPPPRVAKRNHDHDQQGNFRSDAMWKRLFVAQCHDVALWREAWVGEQRSVLGDNKTRELYVAVSGNEHRHFLKAYVLRRARGGREYNLTDGSHE